MGGMDARNVRLTPVAFRRNCCSVCVVSHHEQVALIFTFRVRLFDYTACLVLYEHCLEVTCLVFLSRKVWFQTILTLLLKCLLARSLTISEVRLA